MLSFYRTEATTGFRRASGGVSAPGTRWVSQLRTEQRDDVMGRTNRNTSAVLASMITFLALVAATASVPTAQASELQGRRVATKFKKVDWPPTHTVFGTPTSINGKIKSKKRTKRVVVLQMKLPSGWRQVDRDKTN